MEQVTNEVSAYEQIDFVFDYIKGYLKHSAMISTEYIWNHVKEERTPEMGINRLMFEEIISQLLSDEYISPKAMPEGDAADGQKMYNITFKGRLFTGYAQSNKAFLLEQAYRKQLDDWNIAFQRQQTKSSAQMNLLTFVIAMGTMVAAVYYIVEILNHQLEGMAMWMLVATLLFSVVGIVLSIMYLLLLEVRERKKTISKTTA